MRIGNLNFRLWIDDKGLKQDAQKSGKMAGQAAGDEAGKGLTAGIKKAVKGGELKKGLIQGLGLGAGLGGLTAVTAGVGALTDAIGASIDAASDQREAMSLTGQVFEENTKQIEDWGESASEEFGSAKTEAMNLASGFGTAFKNVGFALDETTDKAMKMTELAADLGSAFNKSSADAALALRSGLLGESEPLRAFGVFLDEAKVKAKAMALGIAKAGDVLTDNQKVLARYALIMEQTADSQGMFGRDTESLADAQKSLQADIANVSAELGEVLLPFMTDLVKLVKNELVPALKDMVAQFDDSADSIRSNEDPLGNLLNLFDDLSERGNESKTAIGAVDEALSNLVDNILDFIQYQNGYTDAVEDQIKVQQLAAETARENARGIGVAASAAASAEQPIEDLGTTGAETGRKLKRAGEVSTTSWKDFAKSILDIARTEVQKAYQIIEDRAALAAANVESAELRKVIATGKATDEQKLRYQELGEEQALLLIDLAENGVKSGKEVNTAVEQMRQRLKTASGREKAAIQLLLDTLDKVGPKARAAYNHISRLVAAVRPLGLPSGPQEFAGGGIRPAGVASWVGEHGPELSVPLTPSLIIPNDLSMALAGAPGGGGGNTYNVNMLDRFEAGSVRDIGWGLRELGEQGHFGRKR